MSNRTQIEKQIQTIDGLRDIISSMRSLAAIYLSRTEERLAGIRAYADTVGRAIEDCLYGREIALPEDEGQGSAVLAFFSEQGLCGRFNEVMAEAAVEHVREVDGPHFVAVGRRGPALLRRAELDVIAELPSTTSPDGQDAVIHRIAKTVLDVIERSGFRRMYLLYARYLSRTVSRELQGMAEFMVQSSRGHRFHSYPVKMLEMEKALQAMEPVLQQQQASPNEELKEKVLA